jgi:hypothetical protein
MIFGEKGSQGRAKNIKKNHREGAVDLDPVF